MPLKYAFCSYELKKYPHLARNLDISKNEFLL